MGNVRDIKRRIKSIDNIKQITRAMKMTAAVRMKRIDSILKKTLPYIEKTKEVESDVMGQMEQDGHQLMEAGAVKKLSIIVICSDKGLCGGYNYNILKNAAGFFEELAKQNLYFDIMLFGSKASRFFAKKSFPIYREFTGWKPGHALAKQVADICIHRFLLKEVDEIWCFYSNPVSSLTQKVERLKILPIEKKAVPDGGEDNAAPRRDVGGNYYFEPDYQKVIDYVFRKYIEGVFLSIFFKSRNAELGARLKAMTNATDNAEKYSHRLGLEFFRIRQEAITTEILEVSSGAEALQK